MLPVVVLIGRPNVGKSTLFNNFTKTRDALVADQPGMTRDRQYGLVEYENKKFTLVDTGGLGVVDADIDALMLNQSNKALEEASIILFVVDARAGLFGVDETIASRLRKLNKPIFVVVNKSEALPKASVLSDFQSLGFRDVFLVSAAHRQGIQPLLSHITSVLYASSFLAEDIVSDVPTSSKTPIKITFIGRPNVGKSTLVNRLLGEERVLVYDMPGTTRDSIAVPFERQDQAYLLIDTAGVRRRARIKEKIETFSVLKTKEAILKAHVCIMLIDATEGITDQDLHLLGLIHDSGKGLIICINKWDGLSEEHRLQVKSALSRRLTFVPFAKVMFISALHGSGVGLLYPEIHKAYNAAMQSFSTTHLTNILINLVDKHPPPMIHGRRIKLRFAHPTGQNPLKIVIHGNQLNELPESYRRYLIKGFTEALDLQNVPVKILYKVSENPYKNKNKKKLQRMPNKKRKRVSVKK